MFNGATTEGDGRLDHVVDVIVPTEDQQFDNPPAMSVPVTGPVCLPPITSASETATPTPSPTPSATKKKK